MGRIMNDITFSRYLGSVIMIMIWGQILAILPKKWFVNDTTFSMFLGSVNMILDLFQWFEVTFLPYCQKNVWDF